jgi:23S rRNA (uridine2552-2'-O)-methyltransferase
MSRSKSSRRWLDRHFSDDYVKQAQERGYRSRAAFKLLEIQEKQRLVKPGQVVVDLGAAPGGWSQVARELVGPEGLVIALDILAMEPLPGVTVIEGDFREDEALQRLKDVLGKREVDLVLSDMAPNISGVAAVDQPRAMYLCELALEFASEALRPGGDFLVKVFQGAGSDAFLQEIRRRFSQVSVKKPAASRAKSREVYVLARNLKI